MTNLVIEYHYIDGDCGAYPAGEVERQLWGGFPGGRNPPHPASHILIRPDTEDGQRFSDMLHQKTRASVQQNFVEMRIKDRRTKKAMRFKAKAERVECPHCGKWSDGLLGDPRGKEAVCDSCEKHFEIDEQAEPEIE